MLPVEPVVTVRQGRPRSQLWMIMNENDSSERSSFPKSSGTRQTCRRRLRVAHTKVDDSRQSIIIEIRQLEIYDNLCQSSYMPSRLTLRGLPSESVCVCGWLSWRQVFIWRCLFTFNLFWRLRLNKFRLSSWSQQRYKFEWTCFGFCECYERRQSRFWRYEFPQPPGGLYRGGCSCDVNRISLRSLIHVENRLLVDLDCSR